MVIQSLTKLEVLEKKIFRKNQTLSAYLSRYDFQNNVRKFFLNKRVSKYLNFGDFKVPKNGSSR